MTAIALELDSARTRSPSRVDWKRYAACYDLLAAINPAYVQLLEEFRAFCRVNLREGMRVLDLGGGTGNFFCHALPDELKDRCELIHLDSDAEMISIAREKYRQHGLKVELIHRDASRTVFPAGHLDCIVSVNALYAMPTPIQVLRRTLRWLRPGASFFLVDLGRVLDTREWRSFLVKSNIPRIGRFEHFARFSRKEASLRGQTERLWNANATEPIGNTPPRNCGQFSKRLVSNWTMFVLYIGVTAISHTATGHYRDLSVQHTARPTYRFIAAHDREVLHALGHCHCGACVALFRA